MSEERLRKDINSLKRLTNGYMPEYHQDIENVLDRLEQLQQENQQLKSVIDKIRAYINNIPYKDLEPIEVQVISKILDKVKE